MEQAHEASIRDPVPFREGPGESFHAGLEHKEEVEQQRRPDKKNGVLRGQRAARAVLSRRLPSGGGRQVGHEGIDHGPGHEEQQQGSRPPMPHDHRTRINQYGPRTLGRLFEQIAEGIGIDIAVQQAVARVGIGLHHAGEIGAHARRYTIRRGGRFDDTHNVAHARRIDLRRNTAHRGGGVLRGGKGGGARSGCEEAEEIDRGLPMWRLGEKEVVSAADLHRRRFAKAVGKNGEVEGAQFKVLRNLALHFADQPGAVGHHGGFAIKKLQLGRGVAHALPTGLEMVPRQPLHNVGGAFEGRGRAGAGHHLLIGPIRLGSGEVVVCGPQYPVGILLVDAGESKGGDACLLNLVAEQEEFVPGARDFPALFVEEPFVVEDHIGGIGEGNGPYLFFFLPAFQGAGQKRVAPLCVALPVGAVEPGGQIEELSGADQVVPGHAPCIGGVGIGPLDDADAHFVADARVAIEVHRHARSFGLESTCRFLEEANAVAAGEDGDFDDGGIRCHGRRACREQERPDGCGKAAPSSRTLKSFAWVWHGHGRWSRARSESSEREGRAMDA